MTGNAQNPYVRHGYTVETVYVGTAGHLRRYKVCGPDGRYVVGGLFRTTAEADGFIADLLRKERTS